MAVFLARIVIPFSFSRSMESMTRSATSWFSRKAPDCHSILSTRVVLPWSTWATMATFLRSARSATWRLRGEEGGTQQTRMNQSEPLFRPCRERSGWGIMGPVMIGPQRPGPLVGDDRALLAAIVDATEQAVISVALDGSVTSWNRGAQDLYGWTAE